LPVRSPAIALTANSKTTAISFFIGVMLLVRSAWPPDSGAS
jgi:hypothetical protein